MIQKDTERNGHAPWPPEQLLSFHDTEVLVQCPLGHKPHEQRPLPVLLTLVSPAPGGVPSTGME